MCKAEGHGMKVKTTFFYDADLVSGAHDDILPGQQ